MIEGLLVILALAEVGYIPIAAAMGVSEPRIFYLLQGMTGAGFFVLAGLILHRKQWPRIVSAALYLVALFGVYEQLLVVGCGMARLYEPVFRAPPGQGLCGSNWTGFNLTLFTALIWFVAVALYERARN